MMWIACSSRSKLARSCARSTAGGPGGIAFAAVRTTHTRRGRTRLRPGASTRPPVACTLKAPTPGTRRDARGWIEIRSRRPRRLSCGSLFDQVETIVIRNINLGNTASGADIRGPSCLVQRTLCFTRRPASQCGRVRATTLAPNSPIDCKPGVVEH
jgi:hypothetical protein